MYIINKYELGQRNFGTYSNYLEALNFNRHSKY